MTRYDEAVARGRARHPNFTEEALAPQFVPFFNTGERITVATGDFVRTGTVGITTGWIPAFILMHRSSDRGSWDLLGDSDRITHVKRGRTYIPWEGP